MTPPRWSLLIVAVVVLAGCSAEGPPQVTKTSGAAYAFGGPSPGVKMPLANIELRFSIKDRLIAETSADAAGKYVISLAPGDYEVHPMSNMCPGVARVTVPAAPTAIADIICPIP